MPERKKITLLYVLLVWQAVNLAIDSYSIYDRRQIKHAQEMSRRMLDSRARIQRTVVCHHWREFSEAEKNVVRDNWEGAEYGLPPCEEK